MWPRNFTRVRKKGDLSGAAFKFSFLSIWWYCSKIVHISSFGCDCIKTSSKYVIACFFIISGLKILLIKAEKAAGPMDIQENNLLNSYCWLPITNCVTPRDCSSNGIWLYALFISAVAKYLPFIFVRITSKGSMGQLHFDSSISELRYLASRTIFSDSPLAKTITGLINVLPFFLLVIIFHIVLKCQVICLLYLVNISVL